jgi:hypothetical protein
VLALCVGFRRLGDYNATAGAAGPAITRWPSDAKLHRDVVRATLVIALHPQCACSQASVAELARVVARAGRPLQVYALAVIPDGVNEAEWEKTALIRHAAEIPGVQLVIDHGGTEARRFGAQTSGLASLYAPDGRLLFRGGITGSRGHAGDNSGEDALLAALKGKPPEVGQSPVFGCALFAEAAPGQDLRIQLSPRGNGGAK